MPIVGRTVSKDSAAYSYLPKSVEAFPEGQRFLELLTVAGGREAQARPVTGGIATIYSTRK